MWERRTAIVATAHFILKQKDVTDTFKIAKILVNDPEDLVNKGNGLDAAYGRRCESWEASKLSR